MKKPESASEAMQMFIDKVDVFLAGGDWDAFWKENPLCIYASPDAWWHCTFCPLYIADELLCSEYTTEKFDITLSELNDDKFTREEREEWLRAARPELVEYLETITQKERKEKIKEDTEDELGPLWFKLDEFQQKYFYPGSAVYLNARGELTTNNANAPMPLPIAYVGDKLINADGVFVFIHPQTGCNDIVENAKLADMRDAANHSDAESTEEG